MNEKEEQRKKSELQKLLEREEKARFVSKDEDPDKDNVWNVRRKAYRDAPHDYKTPKDKPVNGK